MQADHQPGSRYLQLSLLLTNSLTINQSISTVCISKNLVSLQKLQIDRCPQIDDGGIAHLCSEGITKTLTTLSLIRVPISNKSLEVLCKLESLQYLHFSNSGNLTSDAIATLLSSCVELQQVYLFHLEFFLFDLVYFHFFFFFFDKEKVFSIAKCQHRV